MFEIKNLSVSSLEQPILEDVNLIVKSGEIHLIMGPNGSGKSTLLQTILGNPNFKVTSGKILFNSEEVTKLTPTARALKGIFVSFQTPPELEGVDVSLYLHQLHNLHNKPALSPIKFKKHFLDKNLEALSLPLEFANRFLNVDFSGGERKKMEILQMLAINPKISFFDEIDSGVDVDSLKIIYSQLGEFAKNTKTPLILVTHHTQILDYVNPTRVHIMKNGTIVESGGKSLVGKLKDVGYSSYGAK
jgi:Fe-S cluster assembly ATP-binding protein